MKTIIQFILVIVIAGGAGFGLQRYLQQDERELAADMPRPATNKVIGQMRPGFEIADTEGQLRNVSEWDDQVLLINFWATWCPPCKKEMPAFIELQEQYAEQGFKVIGIALDDLQSVQDFADTIGVNYPLLIAEYDGIDLSRSYGNHVGALPFSAFVDRQGKVVSTHMGELSKTQVEDIIKPLL
ncbi:MAG TPA: TlpA disulfide reductase family protein [Gammaproteobacteria bacterium]